MTNKELRDRGELYDANYDPELVRLMDECKDKCWEYNQIKPSDWAAKDAKLREIIGSVGSGVRVQAPFWCDYGTNITFGENFYANRVREECIWSAQLRLPYGRASAGCRAPQQRA